MAVVGCSRKKNAVLEQGRQVPQAAGQTGIDGVAQAVTGRRSVVGFIKDQQALHRGLVFPALALLQPHPQRGRVFRVAQQGVGDQEAAAGAPWVGAVTPLLAHLGHIGPVHHGEGKAKAAGHLLLPLAQDRRRAADHDPLDALAQQHLPQDQAGLDRFAQAHVIGDKQAHPGHLERLAQWFELVGLDVDAGPVGGLEQFGVGGGDAVPAQGVEVGGELFRLVKSPLGHRLPAALPKHLKVDLTAQKYGEALTDGVVFHAGQGHDPVTPIRHLAVHGGLHLFHQVAAGTAAHHGSWFELMAGTGRRGGHALSSSIHWRRVFAISRIRCTRKASRSKNPLSRRSARISCLPRR